MAVKGFLCGHEIKKCRNKRPYVIPAFRAVKPYSASMLYRRKNRLDGCQHGKQEICVCPMLATLAPAGRLRNLFDLFHDLSCAINAPRCQPGMLGNRANRRARILHQEIGDGIAFAREDLPGDCSGHSDRATGRLAHPFCPRKLTRLCEIPPCLLDLVFHQARVSCRIEQARLRVFLDVVIDGIFDGIG